MEALLKARTRVKIALGRKKFLYLSLTSVVAAAIRRLLQGSGVALLAFRPNTAGRRRLDVRCFVILRASAPAERAVHLPPIPPAPPAINVASPLGCGRRVRRHPTAATPARFRGLFQTTCHVPGLELEARRATHFAGRGIPWKYSRRGLGSYVVAPAHALPLFSGSMPSMPYTPALAYCDLLRDRIGPPRCRAFHVCRGREKARVGGSAAWTPLNQSHGETRVAL